MGGPGLRLKVAAPRKYPLPTTQLRVALTAARDSGVEFESAWVASLREVRWPYDTEHRREWRAVIEEGKTIWQAAYERRELPDVRRFDVSVLASAHRLYERKGIAA